MRLCTLSSEKLVLMGRVCGLGGVWDECYCAIFAGGLARSFEKAAKYSLGVILQGRVFSGLILCWGIFLSVVQDYYSWWFLSLGDLNMIYV